jgi:WD40 repeat protein
LSPDGSRMLMATVGRSEKPLDGNMATTKFNMLVSWDATGMTEFVYGPRIELTAGFGCMAFSPDGKEVMVGGALPQIYRWKPGSRDLRSGRRFFKHGDTVTSLTFSSDGRLAASAGMDRKVCVFDTAKTDGAPLTTLSGPHTVFLSVALSAGGRHALAGGRDGKAVLWDVGDDPAATITKAAQELQWHDKDSAVTAVTFDPSDRRLFLTGSDDGTICLGEIGKDQPVWTEPSRGGGAIRALTVSADGRYVLVADEMGLGQYPIVRDVTALAKPGPSGPDAEVAPAEARAH